jgi:hypothetical protein
MKIKFAVFSFVLLLSASAAFSQSLTSTFFANGNEFNVVIGNKDLENTPSWNPEKDEAAPLVLQRAIEIGRENLKKFVPATHEKWSVMAIHLQEISKNHWIYMISFSCSKECGSEAGNLTIFVKMDGTIIEPTIKPHVRQ